MKSTIIKRIMKNEHIRLILISIIGIIIIISSSLTYFGDITNYLISKEQEQLLTISTTVADSIERFFLNYERSFKIMTANETLKELSKEIKIESVPYIEGYYAINSDVIENISIINKNSEEIYSVKKQIKAEKNIRKSSMKKTLYYSDIYIEDNKLYIDMNIPYVVNSEVEFTIVAKFSLDTIYKHLVEYIRVGSKGYASVKDSNGIIIMHPKSEDIGEDVIKARKLEFPDYDWSELEELVELQKSGKSGVGTYYSIWYHDKFKENVKKISAYSPANVGNFFWIVTVSMDYLEMTDFIRITSIKSAVLISILVIIYIILMMYIFFINRKRLRLELDLAYSRKINDLNLKLEKDIEERIKLHGKIEKNIEKYEKLFNGASDCIFVFKVDSFGNTSNLYEVNDKASNSLKYEKEYLYQKRFLDITKDINELKFANIIESIIKNKSNYFETILLTKNREEIYVEINAHIITINDSESIVFIGRDITNRKVQEQALVRSQDRFRNIVNEVAKEVNVNPINNMSISEDKFKFALELERINMELEKMFNEKVLENKKKEALMVYQSRLAAMGEMIGNIAHQWRQPLSTISMILANIHESYELNELTKEYLDEKIEKSSNLIEYMSKTIDDFRYFFNPKDDVKEFSAKEMVEFAYNFSSDNMRLNNIKIELDEKKEVILNGYPNHFAQVLFILMQNSCDAIISNKILNGLIRIEIDKIEDYARLTISDNGGGVEYKDLDKLFTHHFTTKSKEEGSGVGLYMCKTVIEKSFKGKIEALNAESGLKVIIHVPLGGI
ncbi:MAG: ATP-binding protein [Acidaminobacteraceae bacterium]